jgi:hypothetical protein
MTTRILKEPIPCPCCNRPMRLASLTTRSDIPDLCAFSCSICSVWMTQADEAAVVADQPGAPRARRSAQGK